MSPFVVVFLVVVLLIYVAFISIRPLHVLLSYCLVVLLVLIALVGVFGLVLFVWVLCWPPFGLT